MPYRRYPITFLVVIALAMMTVVVLLAVLVWPERETARRTISPTLTAPPL